MPRDYRREYAKFQSSPKAKAERAARNRNRRAAERAGHVRKGDGREIDHRNGNPMDNRRSNLRIVSRSVNRRKK